MKPLNFKIKKVLYLATPLILSNFINAASGLISMYLLSQINTDALAAGAIITSTYGFIMMMVISMLYSVSILIGKMYGTGEHQQIGPIVFSGISITLVVGIPLTVLMQYMHLILRLLGQPETVSLLASDYFKGLAFGLIPSLMSVVYMQLFMGTASSKMILYLTMMGVVINSALTYALIFGYGPIPAMNVWGAGLASSITAYVMLMITLLYTLLSKHHATHQLFHYQSFHLKYAPTLLKIGIPISVQYTAEILAFSTVTYLMGIMGTAALSAQQIALQCSMIGMMIVIAISQAGSLLMSQSLGKNEPEYSMAIANTAIALGALIMLFFGIIYWFFPLKLMSLYMNTEDPSLSDTIHLTKIILLITAFTQFFDSGRNIAAGLLRGLGDTKTSMWTGILSCWIIGIPAAIFLGFIVEFGAPGIRLGMLFGIIIGWIRLQKKVRRILK